MRFFSFFDRISVEGVAPERSLLRLRRAKIAVYDVEKVGKNQILFSVKKKDTEKVFAIYPNVCYNISTYNPYTVKKIRSEGLGGKVEYVKKRMGLLLGGLLFFACFAFCEPYVYSIEFVGSNVYRREALQALAEAGIKPFSRYNQNQMDEVCAKMLALDGVEYCSVKKSGSRAVVELRTSPFAQRQLITGEMRSTRTGTVVGITALRGTALKKPGETVNAGEVLVGDYFQTLDGERVRVEIIARARIACAYEAEIQAVDERAAFAQAYLDLQLSPDDEIIETSVTQIDTKIDGLFHVKISYVAIEKINI